MKIWDPLGRIVCFTAAALLVPFMRKASYSTIPWHHQHLGRARIAGSHVKYIVQG